MTNDIPNEKQDLIGDISVKIDVKLGKTTMLIGDLLKIGQGSVIELDKDAGKPLDIYVEGKHVGVGEVVKVGDHYGVRIKELFNKCKDEK